MYRLMPAIRLLKDELEKGIIGPIINFKIRDYHNSYLSKGKIGSWRTNKLSGGGAFLDIGVHLIDIVIYILGDIKEAEFDSSIHFKDRTSVDEYTECKLTLANGTRGMIEVSRVFAEERQTAGIDIYGEKGSIKLDLYNAFSVRIHDYQTGDTWIKQVSISHPSMTFFPTKRESIGTFQDCHTASIVSFANQIAGIEGVVGADFQDGVKCQEIMSQLYERS